MLNQLDTLIGFVVVMSVVSLLIMVATQMVSSLLGLRGQNLADALVVLFQQADSGIAQDEAGALADSVLTHPAVTGSTLSARRPPGFFRRWIPFVERLRHQWMRAEAVRPDELLHLLRQKAEQPTAELVTALAKAKAGLAKVPNRGDLVTQLSALTAAETALAGSPPASTAVDQALGALEAAAGGLSSRERTRAAWVKVVVVIRTARRVAAAVPADAAEAEKKFESWFNSCQDRASQWFTTHARIVTGLAACIAAFSLQLDSLDLLGSLSSSPELRAQLAAQADTLQHQLQISQTNSSDLSTQEKQFAELYAASSKGPIQLVPNPYPHASISWNSRWSFQHPFSEQPWSISGNWSWPRRRLLGILLSVALLSLGGPFWFNALRTLSNLRPSLANSVDDQPKQTPAN